MDLTQAAIEVTGIGSAHSVLLGWRVRAILGMDVSCLASAAKNR